MLKESGRGGGLSSTLSVKSKSSAMFSCMGSSNPFTSGLFLDR